MCTAVTYKTKDFYFGRNLDYEISYNEMIIITPRNYRFKFRNVKNQPKHFAMIGMATVAENYPLYFDATNEKGLSMAGLNFPDNACYKPMRCDKDNVAPFEFIPYVLSQCESVSDAEKLLENVNLVKINFNENLPLAPLHWIISDKKKSITVEQVQDGLKVYDNPVGVLTNNPPFPYHLYNLSNYMSVSAGETENKFAEKLKLKAYSRGMGSIGLPGDMSSASRFVRAAFTKYNSVSGKGEASSVNQFFHILNSVAQPRGCTKLGDQYEITIYSSCCNTDKGVYYYTTYENSAVTGVDMNKEDLNGKDLIIYKLKSAPEFNIQN